MNTKKTDDKPKDEKKKGDLPRQVITSQRLPNRPGNYLDRQIRPSNIEKH